ncbi:YjbH domain-containing protein [Vibrio sp.]|uniref:YjbH domain-containing protein n=1 Tax=Vibrio sp. TaxID=678 RepID=UPI003AA8082E
MQTRKKASSITTTIALALISPAIFANTSIDHLPSHQSFTGLTNTPNAQVQNTGDFSLYYGQGVPYKQGIGELDNWVGSFGLFPGFEISGRVVTQTYDCNIYTETNCGIRDLSASAKYQLPFIYDYTGLNVAIGAQDIGGAANNFQTTYIIADKSFDFAPLRMSLGYGQSKIASGIMDGPFGGIEIQPLSFLQFTGEYDATEFNSSIKAMTPDGLLPYDIQVSANYQVYTTREDTNHDIWGVNVSVPVSGYQMSQPYNISQHKDTPKAIMQAGLASTDNASLTRLSRALENEGFLNIQVGKRQNTIVVALENRRYNRNQIDGVGVALGIITANAGKTLKDDLEIQSDDTPIEMVMLSNGIPMMSISLEAKCYREFLITGIQCSKLKFSTDKLTQSLDNITWQHHIINSGIGRSQFIVSPATRYAFATEYGFLDYSLALATNAYVPLWQGFAVDIRYLLPIDNSDDYEQGRIWGESQFENEIDRALVHQAFRLPFNIMTQFSAGYVYSGYIGAANETTWYSPEGQHSISVQTSKFTYKDDVNEYGEQIEDKSTLLGSYTLSIPQYNWQLDLTAGEFWQGDRGYQVTTNHWLGDVKVFASYLNSEDEQFVTAGISIPLNFWRSMKPGYIQLKGIEEFTLATQTRIGENHNQLNTGLGSKLSFQHDLSKQYYNRSRFTPSYFNSNVDRLRNAYLKYLTL